jgi:hypothetical protein
MLKPNSEQIDNFVLLMKKVTAILLFLLYGAASSGATLHFHYCMGKLQSVGVITESKDRCDNCGMTAGDNACCKDVHKTIKAQKDYQHAAIGFILPATVAPAHVYPVITKETPAIQYAQARFAHGPPGTVPLFVQFRNFRI